MGNVANISSYEFPKQGSWLGKQTNVCFHYDTKQMLKGTVVRDDMEAPWVTIIQLEDGRVVLASECQHQPIESSASRTERT